jgi:CubicO group peptidase (beta-lactamase class C family)
MRRIRAFWGDIVSSKIAPASFSILENPAGKTYLKGGAGLVGTVEDYLKFAQMVLNGGELDGRRYLSKKMVAFMLSEHTVGMGARQSPRPGRATGLGSAGAFDSMMVLPGCPVQRAMPCGPAHGARASGLIRRKNSSAF